MKIYLAVFALLSLLTASSVGFAQVDKNKTKPGATQKKSIGDQAVVMGTKQLPGEFGKIGTTYTIGKERPINFTLLSAEYRADRFVGGNSVGLIESWVPMKDQKLLVIKYTVQNPTSVDSRLWYNSLSIFAVSPDSANAKIVNQPWIAGQNSYKEVQLKPAQKVTLTAAMIVSGQGETPKLIIQRNDDVPNAAVIRYDLRGKVAKIADPAFSDDGITTKETVEGKMGTYYPWLGSDFQVVGVEDVATKIPDIDTPADYKQVAIKLKFRGVTPVIGRVWHGEFYVRVTTSDGETVVARYHRRLMRQIRNETFDSDVPVGEEQALRFIVDIPKDTTITGFSFSNHRDQEIRRTYKFTVG